MPHSSPKRRSSDLRLFVKSAAAARRDTAEPPDLASEHGAPSCLVAMDCLQEYSDIGIGSRLAALERNPRPGPLRLDQFIQRIQKLVAIGITHVRILSLDGIADRRGRIFAHADIIDRKSVE